MKHHHHTVLEYVRCARMGTSSKIPILQTILAQKTLLQGLLVPVHQELGGGLGLIEIQ